MRRSSSHAPTPPIHADGRPSVGARTDRRLLLSPAARIGRGREGVALAAGRWCWPRGRMVAGRSSLGALSDARGGVMSELLLDAAGRRRSPATLPHFHAGRPPRNKGIRYPADPPIEEIVTVMRRAGDGVHGRAVAWADRGAVARGAAHLRGACAGKGRPGRAPRFAAGAARQGGRRREVGMDDWAWEQLESWLKARVRLPVGPLVASLAAPRAPRRDGPRGRAADRRPSRARPYQPRHHLR